MHARCVGSIAIRSLRIIVVLGAACPVIAQDTNGTASGMAPLEQYLIENRDSEIALARSAAPESIALAAEVLVLGRHGYETAVQGKNGFVCVVQRSWTSPVDDPDFWSTKLRAPICYNAAAARSYLPRVIRKTDLILAGRSKEQMIEAVSAAIDKKELPPMEPGAMCYMLSKQGIINVHAGHWHPHLMFFISQYEPAEWGASQPDSPILADNDKREHVTTFMVPVKKWSDGTDDDDH
ncbi:hypothetical protein [Occallatibacter riparius]|uniref:Uncharacterized protein n=1 Tax=Occallatibacter riparius TaxID=1002689 RepID=A0A9J7BSI4_9BACT|nr:hypothetical protein [Occallatibacter riparius]UWZ84722.1 hypothetical protein MOP44_02015 [Occallatibacter riparius]